MTDNNDPLIRRRTVLLGTGATAAALTVAAAGTNKLTTTENEAGRTAPVAASAVCTLTKELTEGPYYLDGALVRADVTEGKPGIPLKLTLTVVDNSTCAPLNRALVELWHSDALGEYSGFVGNNGHQEPDNGTFLRGGVLTGSDGIARITTIYPGWYRGRCIHIHAKVHTNVTLTSDGSFSGGQELHTGQLFVDETITTAVARISPYSTNTVPRTTLAQDGIYGNGGAAAGLMTVTGSTSAGYTGSLTLGIDQS
ncbi:intradiol ring-cleavage dioxygenase [Streptomyces sp. JV176]|uniref:intradiol ring-cleavage dioxygenase n=1 Tax=Streptomyces sp. JV176 TaxID=858630 RepID=UPI002E7A03B6|nr:intradiol ring-cleavage dioxygenase [Streptomyces sp. JV176]MEE1800554.1 intradiol ring-cleavage dioxygenase [Streptomyces sp. JV176]